MAPSDFPPPNWFGSLTFILWSLAVKMLRFHCTCTDLPFMNIKILQRVIREQVRRYNVLSLMSNYLVSQFRFASVAMSLGLFLTPLPLCFAHRKPSHLTCHPFWDPKTQKTLSLK
ncbi:hypothetical protein AVEN_230229-1 [Araneus ventricosus]|uniref:Uncharacterized protein n=1 Tax=Araneus ventricosus TaxID=182803 RepID=A0A4Y2DYE8_ARAVE|nr:hypothetical protein AVEN_230229-1 [Araneus ventricosus]